MENEFAWKVDFKTKREQAEAAARPHWQRAEELNNQAAALEAEGGLTRTCLHGASFQVAFHLSHILAGGGYQIKLKSYDGWKML